MADSCVARVSRVAPVSSSAIRYPLRYLLCDELSFLFSLPPSLLLSSGARQVLISGALILPPLHTHTPFSLLSWTIPQVSTASLKRMKANIASCSYKLTAKEQAVSDHVMETFFKPLEGNEHCKDPT